MKIFPYILGVTALMGVLASTERLSSQWAVGKRQ